MKIFWIFPEEVVINKTCWAVNIRTERHNILQYFIFGMLFVGSFIEINYFHRSLNFQTIRVLVISILRITFNRNPKTIKLPYMKKKKNKKILLVLTLTFFTGFLSTAYAQPDIYNNPDYGVDSASRMECANNLSTMSEFMKIDLFDYALPSWKAVFNNCPKSSKNIYLYGVKIYRYKLDNEKDDERIKELLDTLMLIYDRRIENFGQAGLVLGRKGIDMLRYDRSSIEAVYGILGESIDISKEHAEEAVIVTFMQSCMALFKANRIEAQDVIDNYLLTTEILNNIIKSGKGRGRTEVALTNVEALFADSGAGGCEDLISIFTPKFEADPGNLELLKKITSLLSGRNCEDSELFAHTSEKLYSLEPSSTAAFNLARLFLKREKYNKSLDYYQKAIDTEENPEEKAQYCYQKAVLLLNKYDRYSDSRSYAQQAISLKGNWGAPYILIGNTYAASSKTCGENDFEKAAVFLAAVDKFIKAKSVDASVADEANELIKRYEAYFPNVENAFFYGFQEGQAYTVGCWINESTTIRTR